MENQNQQLLTHLSKGFSISVMTAFKKFGITSLHRRLSDLRNGTYNGTCYPIDGGFWAEYNGKRFKVYQMDMTKFLDLKSKRL